MAPNPSDPFGPLAEGAAQIHELHVSYQAAGFTPAESLYLVGVMLTAALRGNQGGTE